MKNMNLKCGITERGDASINMSWKEKLLPNINIIISKNLTNRLIESLLENQTRIIFHHTVTGMGNTKVEPNVPSPNFSHTQIKRLINKGFPVSQIVLRLDPVIPTPKGIKTALSVLELYKDTGIKRVRFSFLDMYPHVKKRFQDAGIRLPYDTFTAPQHMREEFLNKIEQYKDIYEFESCAELNEYKLGCISEKDYSILHLPLPSNTNAGQRKTCGCLSTKTELLDAKQRCPHNCLYCYWRD